MSTRRSGKTGELARSLCIKVFVILVLSLSNCPPAAAQRRPLASRAALAAHPAGSETPWRLLSATRFEPLPPAFQAHSREHSRVPAPLFQRPIAPVNAAAFWTQLEAPPSLLEVTDTQDVFLATAPYNAGRNRSEPLESMLDYVETPFVERAGVPVVSLWHGGVQLGGFYSLSPVENVLLGLPGSGSLPAWTATPHAHPGALVPRDDVSYGLSLTIRVPRGSEPGSHMQVWRCLGWVVRARGCHLG
jgi:hypothetical protein